MGVRFEELDLSVRSFNCLRRAGYVTIGDIVDLTEEEIVAVLAHEVGHNKKRHTVQFMLASVIQTGVILWLFSLFVNQPALSMALGGDRACFQLGLIAFTILYSPLSMILGLVMNAWSRKNEYQADAFAARYYDGESLISGLKKISVKSLSNLTPHPLYEWVYYSHPSLLKRIREIRRLNILKRMSISIRRFLRKIPIQILFTPIFVCAMPVTTKFTSLLRFARQKTMNL